MKFNKLFIKKSKEKSVGLIFLSSNISYVKVCLQVAFFQPIFRQKVTQ